MSLFGEIIGLISGYFIKGIFASVIVIMVSRKLLPGNFNTQNAIQIIRWLLLSYSIIVSIYTLLLILFSAYSNDYSFQERATGPYNFAFWMVAFGSMVPLILVFNNFGYKIYLILILSILVNLGWLMESLVIHSISVHRDYSGNGGDLKGFIPSNAELIIILQGACLGALALLIGNLPFWRKIEPNAN